MKFRAYIAAGVASVLTLATLSAEAKELRVASGVPQTHAAYDPMYTTLISRLEELSGGDITGRHLGIEIVGLRGVLSSLQGGIIDVGNLLTLYFPAEFPNAMLINELAALGKNGQSMMAAVTEYMMTCESCQAEFAKQGIVYLGASATPPYGIISTTPVASMADLKGKRLRSGGAPFTRWAEALGADPREVSFNEEYEMIANGLLDGAMNDSSVMLSGKLYEIASYYTPIPIGTFHSASAFSVRSATWKDLSPEQRGWVAQAALPGLVSFDPGVRKDSVRAKEAGATFVEPAADLVEANAAYEETSIQQVIEMGKTRYGLADAEEKVRRFASLVEKWRGIIEEIGQDDQAALVKRMDEEIFSKMDWSTYGM